MSNVFKVSNEDVKHLCDFMGIDAVRHSDVSYSWSDGPYSTHEDEQFIDWCIERFKNAKLQDNTGTNGDVSPPPNFPENNADTGN